MPKLVVFGAMLRCSKGTTPSTLSVLPGTVSGDELNAATIQNHVPMVNVPPFGMCTTQTNPMVAAATAAAQGVLTPQPCIPILPAPWTNGAQIISIDGIPALTGASRCQCQWGGAIEVAQEGSTVEVE
jgi:hypothetical protein